MEDIERAVDGQRAVCDLIGLRGGTAEGWDLSGTVERCVVDGTVTVEVDLVVVGTERVKSEVLKKDIV